MATTERLDSYQFHEHEWESFDELRDWFEWEVPDRFNMAAYVCDRWAEETPDATALFVEGESGEQGTYTFAEFEAAASRLANHLAASGVARGDRVGVNLPQKPEAAIAHVAAWKLGAVSVPLSTLFGPDGVGYRLADADANACIVDGSNVDALRRARADYDIGLQSVLVVDGDPEDDERSYDDAVADRSPDHEAVETDAEDDALLIYTSGTTGDPKGVRHAHRVLLGHLPGIQTVGNFEFGEGTRFWTPAEWAWIASLFNIVFTALFYGRPVLAHHGGEFDPATAFDLLDRYDITMAFLPPTALRFMMQVPSEGYDVDSLRVIGSGGESLGESVAEWAEDTFGGALVHEGYGQTEANVAVVENATLAEKRPGSMGLATPGYEVTVVDPETAEPTVEPGEVGEIAIRYEGNPICFKEYWNKPEKTAGKVQNGWLLTEDLGTVDEDGYFSFEARKDDVIISSGYRIGPEEIEDSLASHDAVADAAVIGVPHEERGEIPKAFVVLADGQAASDDLRSALMDHVKDRLAKYEYPREVEFVDELPRTTTGKVRRQSLREREGIAD
ncbi:acyl-CoA synthetase [Haloglomus litoreum]|uniref:acyl-CoA synthetase n=1 Tax=Haloglomus litoreum TaxID=3034026 RepID=UPI0023E76AC0|nr:AMP-binding protein [Haloglomus sp. DT116]